MLKKAGQIFVVAILKYHKESSVLSIANYILNFYNIGILS